MSSLRFVFSSPLLAPLVEFVTSSSGHVEPRQGLALGWLSSVVAGLAVVFGSAEKAQAGYCYGIPVGQSRWICTNHMCKFDDHGNGLAAWEKYYVHGNAKCQPTIQYCACPP